jgi:ribosomal protein RSM22 (predicted rRNA methylase)
MQLPPPLQVAVERELRRFSPAELSAAAVRLTESYRTAGGDGRVLLRGAAAAAAYAGWRMPATFAAVSAAAAAAAHSLPDFAPQTALDLGSGSGAALWAISGRWPSLQQIHALEREAELRDLARRLRSSVPAPAVDWQAADLTRLTAPPAAELVVAAYVLGELSPADRHALLARVWAAGCTLLLLVEPGTPRGAAVIGAARNQLLQAGATIAAPCPHHAVCPLSGDDWCHFAQRVARPAFQRRLKGAAAPFEDEKFSYLAVTRLPVTRPAARLLRRPETAAGHIRLTLCSADGLQHTTVTRSQRDAWRAARDSDWGAGWSPAD